jgi:hypothetical protein
LTNRAESVVWAKIDAGMTPAELTGRIGCPAGEPADENATPEPSEVAGTRQTGRVAVSPSSRRPADRPP